MFLKAPRFEVSGGGGPKKGFGLLTHPLHMDPMKTNRARFHEARAKIAKFRRDPRNANSESCVTMPFLFYLISKPGQRVTAPHLPLRHLDSRTQILARAASMGRWSSRSPKLINLPAASLETIDPLWEIPTRSMARKPCHPLPSGKEHTSSAQLLAFPRAGFALEELPANALQLKVLDHLSQLDPEKRRIGSEMLRNPMSDFRLQLV